MLRDILTSLCALAGTLLFVQIPEFLQQYLQRLGGALDALRSVNDQALADRIARLGDAVTALETATALTRPLEFIRYLQPDAAWGTVKVFKPAIPATVEGLIYGLIGLLFGVLVANLLRLTFRRRRKSKPAQRML
ncbi:MAG TPA: DUF2937 family protein [Candidatus Cybelea sp.]|nr:DUF2937 family protein [Candidatus Cybelea sp.]